MGQYEKVDCLYYRTDIAEKAGEIAGLLRDCVRRGGVVRAFC
ncbi:MAG: hypothetical protein ACI4D5_09020 [Kineothrix sp.]